MEAQRKPYILIVAGVLLTLLVASAILAPLLTRRFAQKATKNTDISFPTSITPSPGVSSTIDLPRSFPSDMPVVKRSKVTVAKEDAQGWAAVFLTVQTAQEAQKFYQEELPKAGWSITNQSQAAGLAIIYADKATYSAIIAIGKGDKGVTVSITILKS